MITWTCHICKEERPDDKISVFTKPIIRDGAVLGAENIRYCNDKPKCIEGAKKFSFFGEKKYYYLLDSDGGEHEFYGTLEDAKAEALERGYGVDSIMEEE